MKKPAKPMKKAVKPMAKGKPGRGAPSGSEDKSMGGFGGGKVTDRGMKR